MIQETLCKKNQRYKCCVLNLIELMPYIPILCSLCILQSTKDAVAVTVLLWFSAACSSPVARDLLYASACGMYTRESTKIFLSNQTILQDSNDLKASERCLKAIISESKESKV